jgi:Zn-dependent M28 family amino/carboxypeptidase
VIGVIEGNDPVLSEEYILLSAHYDHIGKGLQANPRGNFVDNDSIYNGARDNAIGTTALLLAAEGFTKKPAARSIIFVALTGEELGLLGSSYYADNPVIPLENTVFNLNVDSPGYNSIDHISMQGAGKTNTDALIEKATHASGLQLLKDPVPEQNAYYRSDNIVFARKGIPAIQIHQGITSFDEELTKYYHKAADEANSLNMPYVHKFCRIFVHASRLIADMTERPFWTAGDEFESLAIELYKMKAKN